MTALATARPEGEFGVALELLNYEARSKHEKARRGLD